MCPKIRQLSSESQISEKCLLPPVFTVIHSGAGRGRCRKMPKRHQESSVTKGVKKRKAIQGSLPYPAVTSMHIHPKYSKPCITRKEATTPSSTPTLVSISKMNIPQWFRKKRARSNMVKNMTGIHPSHHPSARRI